MVKILKVSKCSAVLLQMAAGQFMSALRNVAAKIDKACKRLFLVVNDIMPVRALPVQRDNAAYEVCIIVFLKT